MIAFHPHPHGLFRLDLGASMRVHYLQRLRGGLVLGRRVRLRRDVGSLRYRGGGHDGDLLQAAQARGLPEAWRAPVVAVRAHPIVGGVAIPDSAPPLLAVAGSLAWSIGCLAAAFALPRAGRSWIPVVLLAVSGVSFGALAAAAAWLRWEAPG